MNSTATALVLLAGVIGGCSSDKDPTGTTKPATTKITAADFKAPASAAGPQQASVKETAEGEAEAMERPVPTGPIAASGATLDVLAEPGDPAATAANPRPNGPPVFVDAKVGDVNNRAIYASAFLEDMTDRLKAKYEELMKVNPKNAKAMWTVFARNEIQRKLESIIEDEMLRAEALNTLQPEQKAGFFNWLQTVRSEVVAENRGSEAAANENLSAQNGTSLDQTMKNREQQELIRYILHSRIYSRANISWRDIQIAYEKNYDTFNPPPVAFFRDISVAAKRTDEVKRIEDALASGKDFTDLARELAGDTPEKDQVILVPFKGEFAEQEFFSSKELNEAAHTLTPGKWVGPIKVRTSMYWVKLEKIEKLTLDLYQAQLYLEQRLNSARQAYETARFVDHLKQRASYTDVEVMTKRLLSLAEERVFGIGKSGASGAKSATVPTPAGGTSKTGTTSAKGAAVAKDAK